MNEILRTRQQINDSTEWLHKNGYRSHPLQCKDWELKNATDLIGDGDTIDLGADGSFVLHNLINKNTNGRKVGIDLIEVVGDNKAQGAEYFKGDLMNCPFEDNSFDNIVSLSVLEHQVDVRKFAEEVSRLLRDNGKLFLSFDYAPQKIDTSLTKLYSLDWNIQSQEDVINLISVCVEHGLYPTEGMNWDTQDMVVTPQYCSPAQGVSYTFAFLTFLKK